MHASTPARWRCYRVRQGLLEAGLLSIFSSDVQLGNDEADRKLALYVNEEGKGWIAS